MSPQLAAVPDQAETTAFKPGYVERGRQLARAGESTAWELGDYVLEEFPVGDHGVNTGVKDGLKLLAAEIGGEPETLTQYRKVAYSWPEGTRVPSATWAAHRAYMGPPASAPARRRTLESLRNEHGMVTKAAVRAMTKGNTGGKPGWHELLGRVGDDLTAADKHLTEAEAAITRQPSEEFCDKAGKFAERAEALAQRLREIEAA